MKNVIILFVSLFVIYTATAGVLSGTKKLHSYTVKKIEKIIDKNLHHNF